MVEVVITDEVIEGDLGHHSSTTTCSAWQRSGLRSWWLFPMFLSGPSTRRFAVAVGIGFVAAVAIGLVVRSAAYG